MFDSLHDPRFFETKLSAKETGNPRHASVHGEITTPHKLAKPRQIDNRELGQLIANGQNREIEIHLQNGVIIKGRTIKPPIREQNGKKYLRIVDSKRREHLIEIQEIDPISTFVKKPLPVLVDKMKVYVRFDYQGTETSRAYSTTEVSRLPLAEQNEIITSLANKKLPENFQIVRGAKYKQLGERTTGADSFLKGIQYNVEMRGPQGQPIVAEVRIHEPSALLQQTHPGSNAAESWILTIDHSKDARWRFFPAPVWDGVTKQWISGSNWQWQYVELLPLDAEKRAQTSTMILERVRKTMGKTAEHLSDSQIEGYLRKAADDMHVPITTPDLKFSN